MQMPGYLSVFLMHGTVPVRTPGHPMWHHRSDCLSRTPVVDFLCNI
jgi:hypothetical protein